MSADATYRPPPLQRRGAMGWVRAHLFATPTDSVLTLGALALVAWLLPPVVDYLFIDAFWRGADRTACLEGSGFCWPYITGRAGLFVYGTYPEAQRWRVDLVLAMLVGFGGPLLWPGAPFRRTLTALTFGVFPIAAFILLTGGVFGLEPVSTAFWGGLLVTLVVAVTGISASLPLGILLALGRRSNLPVIRLLSTILIEAVRGVPLITLLFMASVMLPLFLPPGVNFDKLLRVLVGMALFASAVMAEVVRAGLQAIPRGQVEAASALGLGYWQSMGFVVLPQALKLVIPGIVNTFISLFKDTTLVLIVGIFDLLGTVHAANSDAVWATPNTAPTGYVFLAFVFWFFCFGMSRYSARMEARLHTGHKRH